MEKDISDALTNQTATRVSNVKDNFHIAPPTYFKANEASFAFQLIVDTYGVPTYQEANPAPVSIVTFPFMFGMMFGDMGHGSILFSFGFFLTMMNTRLQKSAFSMLLPFRYLFLMMGLSSFYCGFCYNEFFAMPVQIFTSCYNLDKKVGRGDFSDPTLKANWFYERTDFNCNYPFGVDPMWGLASNRLTFTNNIKMKLSVIMGVLHMTLGVIMKGTNAIYFKRLPDLVFEVITGLIILLGLFGWMDLLIFAKWFFPLKFSDDKVINLPIIEDGKTVNFNGYNGDLYNKYCPSVINILINAVFGFGSVPGNITQYSFVVGNNYDPTGMDDTKNIPSKDAQDSMYSIALILLAVVFVNVPIMLLVKPCCFRGSAHVEEENEIEFSQIPNQEEPLIDSMAINNRDGSDVVDIMAERTRQNKAIEKHLKSMATHEGAHSFGEMFIHQMIETIEFVLGTVSNTASYLRLWALSLAHSQLAETFFNLTFKLAMSGTSTTVPTILLAIVLWPPFWGITFFVLMCMDCLECFLHTLRLHWVEFQNKFYKGEGYAFKPYKYESILTEVLEG